jgi:hypothetical protein
MPTSFKKRSLRPISAKANLTMSQATFKNRGSQMDFFMQKNLGLHVNQPRYFLV